MFQEQFCPKTSLVHSYHENPTYNKNECDTWNILDINNFFQKSGLEQKKKKV